jgi:hypothetical protein
MKKLFFLLPLAALVILAGCSSQKNLKPEEASTLAEKYINENLMVPGKTVTVDEVTEEYGLYKLIISLPDSNDPIESYLTKDGTKFFPQALEVTNATENANEETNEAPVTKADTSAPKQDKASVELFVMSYCPYGTQIEKGILPVLKALGDKVDFSLKFVDYAMHGEKELKEQLNQYCIDQEQNDKLLAYLECFLADGDSETCLESTGVNTKKLNTCVTKTDKEFKVLDNFNNNVEFKGDYPTFNVFQADNTKYNVAGSPTLIINGVENASARDPQSLLESICAGYNEAPAECETPLSTSNPSAGFGFDVTAASTEASCN